jgi:hypothetical protein
MFLEQDLMARLGNDLIEACKGAGGRLSGEEDGVVSCWLGQNEIVVFDRPEPTIGVRSEGGGMGVSIHSPAEEVGIYHLLHWGNQIRIRARNAHIKIDGSNIDVWMD